MQQLAGGQGRGDRHPPVNAHRLAVTGRGHRRGDHGEGDMPPARAVHRDPVGLRARAARHGTSGTGPTRPWAPRPGRFSGIRAHVPLPPASHDPESLIPPGLAPRRPPGRVPGSKNAAIAWPKSRSACCWTVWEPAASHGCPARAGGELPALLQVARRARPAGVPVGVLFDGQVPHVPGVAAVVPQHRLLGGGGEQPVPGHANILSGAADISGEVTRCFLPGLKTGVSTPRS